MVHAPLDPEALWVEVVAAVILAEVAFADASAQLIPDRFEDVRRVSHNVCIIRLR